MSIVKSVIRDLSNYDSKEELLIAWWDKDILQELAGDIEITEQDVISLAQSDFDFSDVNDQIRRELESIVEERLKQEELQEEDKQLWDTETEKAI